MELLQPETWEEALEAKAANPGAMPLWGGTDVMVEMNFARARPEAILDLTRVRELTEHGPDDGVLRVGAGVTYTRAIAELGDRERRAAFDVRARDQDGLGEVLVFFLAAQNLQALYQRQSGVDHDGELADEHRQILRIDLLAEFPLFRSRSSRRPGLFLGWRDARDEHLLPAQRRHDSIGVISDALAGDVFSAACAARIGKCRHTLLSSLKEQMAESRGRFCPLLSYLCPNV